MKSGEEPTGSGSRHTDPTRQQASERVAGLFPPWRSRPFVRLHWKRISVVLLVLLGFLGELVLRYLVWQLVDLTISLMEVWAELARKHLELTLFWHAWVK